MMPTRTVAAPFSASVSVSFTAVIFRVTWYLSLVALFYSTGVASASIITIPNGVRSGGFPAGARSMSLGLEKRSTTEHVILCDCLSASGIRSSQMAYYSAEVNGLPTAGVGIVDTEFNTTAAWYNGTTSATWADTGVTFKAVIGYHVAEDDYVGKGNNGYGDFRCWQRSKTGFAYDLNGDGNVCEMLIDCNKDAAPSTDPAYVPLESTTTTPATSSSSSSSNPGGNTQQPASVKKGKAISTGAVIGIAIGIVGAFTFLAGGAGFFFARRRRIRKQQEQQHQKGARTESTITEAHAPGADFVKNGGGDPNAVCELDGGWYRHEMGDDTGHYEIDGQVRCEMDGDGGEIKEKMDDLFGEADVKEMIVLNKKADSKKVILDEKIDEKKEGYVVGVSEKENEVRRDKEERERQQQQQPQEQKQQLEEQKRNRDAEELPLVSPLSPLSPASAAGPGAPRTEEVGQPPFCLPAIMPEPEKFMAEEFRAHKEKEKEKKDETNIKFRFEEETQKYMKGEVPLATGAAGSGKDTHASGDNSSCQEGKKKEGLP